MIVPCLSPSPGPQIGPPAMGALPALMRHGDGLGTGGSGDVGDSRTTDGSSMAIGSRTGCGGHLCPPNQARNIPGGFSPGGYRVPKPVPVLAPQKLFLMLHPISWAIPDGHPVMGDPLHPPFPCPPVFCSASSPATMGQGFFSVLFLLSWLQPPCSSLAGGSIPRFRC